ncbi:hypothetical protein CBW24_14130 [Pacificitalea manganoxidans]|uniref:CRISPR system Cascade subunit CasB n=1 Tax=Pacificitalea manganoxidans TaxID=1411902 RepID=A0A291M2A2_9RHOB|nr:hypothetical protein [Pacificitalea manganoxidans]ATI43030.1 hypothetical protein CBW24_14130 [Pacificitalea manganoxidans]MDR6307043.1 CRISPR type I-E-associated protein CasB/Cse2 [Pacificitalea manganoxidans]
MADATLQTGQQSDVASRALTIAQALAHASTRERAETRRMGDEGAPFFWRMPARLGLRPDEERAWLVFTRMAALLTPSTATATFHDRNRPLGAVLADGGAPGGRLEQPVVSEARLARLLAARGDLRLSALERAVRAICRETRALDAASLAWAVINPDGRQIARDYYRRLDGGAPVTKD